jgi:hypothetical protein
VPDTYHHLLQPKSEISIAGRGSDRKPFISADNVVECDSTKRILLQVPWPVRVSVSYQDIESAENLHPEMRPPRGKSR